MPRSTLVAACGCLLGLFPVAIADEVQLLNGGKLSGSVLSIKKGGAIQLESPLSVEPLSLKGDAVKQIAFDRTESVTASGTMRFELANDDFLIGSLLSYSRENGARIHADAIGEFEIPAHSLRSMSLNMQPVKVIYNGPDELANWTSTDRRGAQNWQYNRNRLSVTGTGQIARMLELPDRYVIRANLHWQGQPNFQISFSDPLEESQVRVDRYYLQFGRAGLEIKRETTRGKRDHTVGTLNRTPDQFPNREMDIEIRVDRIQSIIQLTINGKQEGRFMDPFDSPPTAGGISLVSNASRGNQFEIRSLIVESWYETSSKLPLPRREVASQRDSLMMREGDSFGGVLQSIRPVDDGLLFLMKVDFREDPLEILGEDVSMVSFAAEHTAAPPAEAAQASVFVLKLNDHGRLTVTESAFEGGQVRATHPLLGDLTLSRNGVSSLERRLTEETTTTQ